MNDDKKRLAARILGLEPMLLTAIPEVERDSSVLLERAKLQRPFIETAPKLILDDVSRMYAESEQAQWDCGDIPNWAPPWGAFWAEWQCPRRWCIDGKWQESANTWYEGYVCLAMNVTDENRNDLERWEQLLACFSTFAGPRPLPPQQKPLLELLQGARWILAAEFWLSRLDAPVFGRPIWAGLVDLIAVDERGKFLKRYGVGPGCMAFAEVCSPLHVLGLGLSFCHCKNVVRTEIGVEGIPSCSKKERREKGIPTHKYYVLDIKPMRKTLKTEGGSDSVGVPKALHICRGHFAHYTEEKPLFGKYTGDFWIPDHARGSPLRGVVAKDYQVRH